MTRDLAVASDRHFLRQAMATEAYYSPYPRGTARSVFFSVAVNLKFTQSVRIYIFTGDNENKKCIEVIAAAKMSQ